MCAKFEDATPVVSARFARLEPITGSRSDRRIKRNVTAVEKGVMILLTRTGQYTVWLKSFLADLLEIVQVALSTGDKRKCVKGNIEVIGDWTQL